MQLLPQECGPPLLAKCTRTLGFAHVNRDGAGGGVRTLCPLHHLPHQHGPRLCGLLQRMRAAGEAHEVGVGVGDWVGQATMLREGHCKRNQSCTGEQRYGNMRNSENIVHIRVILVRMEIACECE